LKALPDARLLYLKDSGPNAYQDMPERYMAELRAFLPGRPLPARPYKSTNPPGD
jgi:hypothetical protein